VRIKYIIPVLLDIFNKPTEEFLKRYARPDTEITVVNTSIGPETVECGYDSAFAEVAAVLEAEKAEREGYDAVILGCFCDPGGIGAREALNIPVIGIGHSALLLAAVLGERISVITVGNPHTSMVYAHHFAKIAGVESKVVSGRALNIPVEELLLDFDKLINALIESGRKAVELDDADVLVLGCGAIFEAKERMEEALGVPVVDPALAGLKMAETCVELKLCHSKRTFPNPPEKRRVI